jgi:hypothetical protein
MPDLVCVLCLDEGEHPAAAVTVANGQAVCPAHFVTIRDLVSETRGQFALVVYRRPR